MTSGFEPNEASVGTVRTPLFDEEADCAFELCVIAGPDKGRTLVLDGREQNRALVGQSPSCDLRLSDTSASRRHLAITRRGGRLLLSDLGSTNGTYVESVQIVEAYVGGGETVTLGATRLRIDRRTTRVVEPPAEDGFGQVRGASPAMRRLYPLCRRLAESDIPLVIEGETGTGKEVLAEAIHAASRRRDGPFVVFDCTTVPPSLLESELFGHERGAFTGATSQRKGVFEQAIGGTLLIDEIGDLELSLQSRLLRAVERGEIRRVGGSAFITVDVRVIAATRRDLDREVQEGRFRDDLFHRLTVGRIELPPLRERQGDVELLARSFWVELGGAIGALPPELVRSWTVDPWPGNVRELRNAVARRLALGEQAVPAPSPSAPGAGVGPGASPGSSESDGALLALPYPRARDEALERFTQRYVGALLAQHQGDVAKAAAASGIGLRYFQKLRAATRR